MDAKGLEAINLVNEMRAKEADSEGLKPGSEEHGYLTPDVEALLEATDSLTKDERQTLYKKAFGSLWSLAKDLSPHAIDTAEVEDFGDGSVCMIYTIKIDDANGSVDVELWNHTSGSRSVQVLPSHYTDVVGEQIPTPQHWEPAHSYADEKEGRTTVPEEVVDQSSYKYALGRVLDGIETLIVARDKRKLNIPKSPSSIHDLLSNSADYIDKV